MVGHYLSNNNKICYITKIQISSPTKHTQSVARMIAALFSLLFSSFSSESKQPRPPVCSSSSLSHDYSRCGTRETWCQLKATARRVIHHFTSPARGFRRNDSDVWLDSHTLSVTVLVHPDLTQVNRRLVSVRISKWKNPGTWFREEKMA